MKRLAKKWFKGMTAPVTKYALLLFMLPLTLGAQTALDYRVLQPPIQTQASVHLPNSIEVRLLISHGCKACDDFIEHWDEWRAQQPEDVALIETYIVIAYQSELMTEAYWLAQELNIFPQMLELLKALSLEGESVTNVEADLTALYRQFNITTKQVDNARQSMNVVKNMRRTKALSKIYRTRHVPAIIINGKFLADVVSAQGYHRLLSTTELLIEKERIAQLPENPLETEN